MRRAATPATLAFGKLVRELRGSFDQTVFGVRLGGYSRQAVSAVETGKRPPSKRMMELLVRQHPDVRARIEEAYEILLSEQADGAAAPSARPNRQAIRRLEELIATGRQVEAQAAATVALRETEDPGSRIRLLELLSDAVASRREAPTAAWDAAAKWREKARSLFLHSLRPLNDGIKLADEVGLLTESARLRDKLADQLIFRWEYDRALEVVDAGLSLNHDAGLLWLRRGQIRWHQGLLGDAYGALTTAIGTGASRSAAALLRGHVLVEWGKEEAAIPELSEGIAKATDPITEGAARCARGYAFLMAGDGGRAEEDLKRGVELAPDHQWTRYFQALALHKVGRDERALTSIRLALTSTKPESLTPLQLSRLSDLIDELTTPAAAAELSERHRLYYQMWQHFAIKHEVDTQGKRLNALIIERIGRPSQARET